MPDSFGSDVHGCEPRMIITKPDDDQRGGAVTWGVVAFLAFWASILALWLITR